MTGITEDPTAEGKLHLAAIRDGCSNKIVGYSMAECMTSQLAVDALSNAVALRHPAGTVVNPDRGRQSRLARPIADAADPPASRPDVAGSALSPTTPLWNRWLPAPRLEVADDALTCEANTCDVADGVTTSRRD